MKKATKRGAAFAAALTAFVGAAEGVRQTAYPDPATKGPPWTICMGHTEGVKPGDHKTMDECKALLKRDLAIYIRGVEACTTVTLPDQRLVALTSFAYNVGVKAACGSSVVRLINQGQTRAGCDALLRWNRAAGIVFPGLTRRRQNERALCLEGLS